MSPRMWWLVVGGWWLVLGTGASAQEETPPPPMLQAPTEHQPATANHQPDWLPRYDLDIDLDIAAHRAVCQLRATWTNPQAQPTDHLEFNAHSRYVVPDGDVGLMAKTLE